MVYLYIIILWGCGIGNMVILGMFLLDAAVVVENGTFSWGAKGDGPVLTK